MSVEPPSSGRPTGPPSGPLSGPSGPPSHPPGGGGGQGGGRGDGDGKPHGPWWRSTPRIAMLTTAVVVAAVVAVVLTRPGDGSGRRGEVFLQAADSAGQDPFTASSAKKTVAAPGSAAPVAPAGSTNQLRGVDGGAPGLYSGTRNSGSCDVERQITYFRASPPRTKAFAAQAGVQPSGVPAYLRSLTSVQLRADTRVTAHGYRDGGATTYQSVLQAGTAVLVDGHGVPRVRCACGNPLAPPVAQRTTPRTTGTAWPGYRPADVVVVAPAAQVVNVFVIFDQRHDSWFGRHRGDHTGHHDRPARPPADPDPMNPPASTGPSAPASPGNGSKSPPSNPPSSNASSAKPPSSEPPSSAPPSSPSSRPESSKPQSPESQSPGSEPPSSRSPESTPVSPQSPESRGPASESPSSPPSPGPQSAASPASPVSPPAPESPGSPAV
ncbi:DUF6777 domain-containing protein [Streptomyces sp. NPDC007851]|uniref:DUF6777 domain-containing protein n=1 Tax=Streptomyces sp. NPDC007851 TaxID=3155008 RepID=UPI00340F182F